MGSALLNTWIKKKSNYFSVVDPNKYIVLRKNIQAKESSIYNSIDKVQNTQQFDIIIFAIKPQIATKVLRKFIGLKYKKNVLFVSIIAGKKNIFF